MNPDRQAPSALALALAIALLAVVWFATLGHNALVRPDEGRYAEIPREMLASGDWITPRLDGLKYFEKPALQYWATAIAYRGFGLHEWTARLWSALTGFLGILLTGYTGARLYDRRTGFIAAAILASSFLYFAIGHIAILDMGVTFFMLASLATLLLAQTSSSATAQRNWMLACWAAMGLSMLSKGLIGIALPGAVLITYSLVQRDWHIWRRLYLLSGLAVFALITLPWFVLVSRANPEFLWFFFIHEHFERFLTPEAGRVHPWYTFIPVVALGMLPWLAPLIASLREALSGKSQRPRGSFSPESMLWVWSGFIFLFFSVSHSKLVPYILPIFPALALLTARYIASAPGRSLAWQFTLLMPLALALFGLAPLVERSASSEVPLELYARFVPWLQAGALFWLAGAAAASVLVRRNHTLSAIAIMALSGVLMGQSVYLGYDELSPASSGRDIATRIRPWLRPGVPFYSVAMYEQTLPPYLQRTMTLVAHPDEMQFGIQQEPQKWIPTVAEFERIWPRQPYALAVMSPAEYRKLQAHGLAMQVIASDTRRTVVVTPHTGTHP